MWRERQSEIKRDSKPPFSWIPTYVSKVLPTDKSGPIKDQRVLISGDRIYFRSDAPMSFGSDLGTTNSLSDNVLRRWRPIMLVHNFDHNAKSPSQHAVRSFLPENVNMSIQDAHLKRPFKAFWHFRNRYLAVRLPFYTSPTQFCFLRCGRNDTVDRDLVVHMSAQQEKTSILFPQYDWFIQLPRMACDLQYLSRAWAKGHALEFSVKWASRTVVRMWLCWRAETSATIAIRDV